MERDQKTPIFVKIRSKKCLAQGISIKKVTPGVKDAQYEVSLKLSFPFFEYFRQGCYGDRRLPRISFFFPGFRVDYQPQTLQVSLGQLSTFAYF